MWPMPPVRQTRGLDGQALVDELAQRIHLQIMSGELARQLAGHDLEVDSLGELVDERLTIQASRLAHRRHGPHRTVRRSGPGTHRAPCFRAIRSVAAWSVWSLGTSTLASLASSITALVRGSSSSFLPAWRSWSIDVL